MNGQTKAKFHFKATIARPMNNRELYTYSISAAAAAAAIVVFHFHYCLFKMVIRWNSLVNTENANIRNKQVHLAENALRFIWNACIRFFFVSRLKYKKVHSNHELKLKEIILKMCVCSLVVQIIGQIFDLYISFR